MYYLVQRTIASVNGDQRTPPPSPPSQPPEFDVVHRTMNTFNIKAKPNPSWLQNNEGNTSMKAAFEEQHFTGTKVKDISSKSLQSRSSEDQGQSTTFSQTTSSPSYPAMEYPPLYFLLRRLPLLLQSVHSFYKFRWWISYPLQRRVMLSRHLHHAHIYMTYGELLLIIPYYVGVIFCILYTFISPSVSITGKLCRLTLIAALLFSQRNSFITLFLGIPVDRGLFYHKLAGRVAGVMGLLHTAAYYLDPTFRSNTSKITLPRDGVSDLFSNSINISGTMMIIILIAMIMTSIGPIRRHIFELFYYLHIVFAAAFVVCTYYHSGWMVPSFAIMTIGVDWFIRLILMAGFLYPKTGKLRVMTETVVEFTFPKSNFFHYNPGQYVYIAIPEISYFQWHPFSIVSTPNETTVKLFIRKRGTWTTAIHDLAKNKSEVSFLMEGPYGNLSVDLMSSDRKYRNVMLISGGIGSKWVNTIFQ
jgi:predicted ferric reductase